MMQLVVEIVHAGDTEWVLESRNFLEQARGAGRACLGPARARGEAILQGVCSLIIDGYPCRGAGHGDRLRPRAAPVRFPRARPDSRERAGRRTRGCDPDALRRTRARPRRSPRARRAGVGAPANNIARWDGTSWSPL